MIIPKRWRDVESGERVIDPAGRMFHVFPRVIPTMVQLRQDRTTQVHTLVVDPNANVPVVFDEHAIAVANLRAHFGQLIPLKEQ